MAKDLNKMQLTGHLGADPEMRYTAQGSAVTTFRVASNRSWRDQESGETREETEWFRIVTWDRLAEVCAQYLAKGAHVYIEGRLQTRRWVDRDSQERTTVEVVAQDMIILGTPGGRPAALPEMEPAGDGDVVAPEVMVAAEVIPAEAPSRVARASTRRAKPAKVAEAALAPLVEDVPF